MNIRLYMQVLKNHWLLLTVGCLVAILLTAATAVSVSVSPFKLSWKLKPTYGVSSIMLVTQPGFPVGRANIVVANGAPTTAANAIISQYADPSRYDYLAGLYAQLATSGLIVNPVLGKTGSQQNGLLYLDHGKTVGSFTATQLSSAAAATTLPFVEIDAQANSIPQAEEIGTKVTDSLIHYVNSSESAAGITGAQRVVMDVVQQPNLPHEVKGRGIVLPLAVFVLCIFAFVALAFLLENFKREDNTEAAVELRQEPSSPKIRSAVFPRGAGTGAVAARRHAEPEQQS